MSIHAALNHVTHYKYDRPVTLGPQVVRLRPAPHCRSNIISYSLKIEPAGHFVNWQQDPFANYQARLVFPEKATEFKVTVDLVAEMAVKDDKDLDLAARPLGQLLGKNVARIALKRGAYLRDFVYHFAGLLSDRLDKNLILKAMSGHVADYEL